MKVNYTASTPETSLEFVKYQKWKAKNMPSVSASGTDFVAGYNACATKKLIDTPVDKTLLANFANKLKVAIHYNVDIDQFIEDYANGLSLEHYKLLLSNIGEKVKTPDGTGILLNKNTPHNGLYVEEEKTIWTVWYGVNNSQNGYVSKTYDTDQINIID